MKVVARRRVLQKWLRTSKKKQPPFRRKKREFSFEVSSKKRETSFETLNAGLAGAASIPLRTRKKLQGSISMVRMTRGLSITDTTSNNKDIVEGAG
jgi:hypothetical protein